MHAIGDRPLLRAGGSKGQQLFKLRRIIGGHHGSGFLPRAPFHLQHTKLQQKQFLKHQPPPRQRQCGLVGREMNVFQRVPAGTQLLLLP